MDNNKRVIGFYDYTVVLTYLGMILAFAGIVQIINERYGVSIICLMAAGICDMFDGTVAATKERNRYEKGFGIQIDSLCDLISFGVLPALFVYMISGKSVVTAVVAGGYLLCGLIRLAYYNVQEAERQRMSEGRRETYTGVPITMSAIALPITFFAYCTNNKIGLGIFTILLLLLGIGFIYGIEIKKPHIQEIFRYERKPDN